MFTWKVKTVAAATVAVALWTHAGDDREGVPEALKEFQVGNGEVASIEYCKTSSFTGPKGHILRNIPPRVIVKARLSPAEGSNINVEVWLPDPAKWNGRLMGLGNGGAAGRIKAVALVGPLRGGYVAATTDMGTAPNASSGIGNPEVWKDFGFRATHLMTVLAKQLVKAYYGEAPDYSYFFGGSTGGQQALQEAQRYPEDYDGIVA